jgi:hypothetical protein
MLRASVLVFIAVLAAPAQSKWTVPSFHDLIIKMRATRGLSHPMVTTWYFKGPRERNELLPDGSLSGQPFTASIMQCDLHTQVRLFGTQKPTPLSSTARETQKQKKLVAGSALCGSASLRSRRNGYVRFRRYW